MSIEISRLEFPKNPGYYSIIQTSMKWRVSIVGSLFVSAAVVSWAYGGAYFENPTEFGLEGIAIWIATISVFLIFILIIQFTRPFLVKDGIVHLMSPVRLGSSRRTRLISFSEISDVSLVRNVRDKLQIWLTLNDGTRFHIVTMVDEEGKEFAKRFADYFRSERQ